MKSKLIIIIMLSLSFVSCNFLDFDETNEMKTKEDMYKYFSTTESMLTHVYSYMPQGFNFNSNNAMAMRDCGSDDAEFGATGDLIQNFNNGNWSSVNIVDDAWSLYSGIRAANNFIEEIANVDFSRYQHDGNYKNWMAKLKYFPYEVRVLRSFYFFELAKRYGNIAMPLTALTKEEANSIEKTSFEDVVKFIVDECDEAASNLPASYINEPGQQVGRITRGFAMALKSKALLYSASRLHNPSMDVELWKKSAKAALDIIDSKLYSLDPKVSVNNLTSKEVVLMRMNGDNATFELLNFPIRFTEGQRNANTINHSNYPSQNLVDAFETINGYSVKLEDIGWVSEDPAFNPQAPFDNRDPRFYRTILANGMNFKDSKIEVYEGGLDDRPVTQGGTPTGYFLKKYIQETTNFTPDKKVVNKHHWVVYRYAETLLAYAESMINAFSDPSYTDDTFRYSALWSINEVRANAGMPLINELNKEDFIIRLQNEWRVEFAFEDHRFWDVRRWKIADATQRELYGVKIKKDANGNLKFHKNLYETRKWRDAMYLFPIPQTELFKNTNLEPQNTGW